METKNIVLRIKLVGVDDTKGIQGVRATGRDSELIGSEKNPVLRHQPAGISSNPSKGVGLVLNLGGNSDQAICIALENPDKRPTGLQPGETKVYDENDQSLYFQNDKAVLTVKELEINVTGGITITAGGSVVVDAPEVHLGGEGGQPVATLGSTDSGGDTITGNCATKVFAS